MVQFKNLFKSLTPGIKINFKIVANARKTKMEQEGFNTDYINWEHYAKVLEAKAAKIASA